MFDVKLSTLVTWVMFILNVLFYERTNPRLTFSCEFPIFHVEDFQLTRGAHWLGWPEPKPSPLWAGPGLKFRPVL